MNAALAIVRTYWLESKLEFLKNLRLPVFSLSTLLLPVVFCLTFGRASGGDPIRTCSKSLRPPWLCNYSPKRCISLALYANIERVNAIFC